MKITKKQKSLIVTSVLYSVVALVFAITLGTVFIFANGYKPAIIGGKLTLEKTGMLIVSSRPSDASLSINGKHSQNTGFYLFPSRVSGMLPGWYDIALTKSGYQSWKNRLQIEPGLVTWANYALLFPNKLDLRPVEKVSSGYLGSSENGHNLLFYDRRGTNMTVTSYDSASFAEKSFWPANTDSLPDYVKNPTISSGVIDNENNHVLLTLKNGDGESMVLLDASGNEPRIVLLSDQLKSTITLASFNPANGNELYLKTNNNLYRYSISAKTLGDSLADSVVSYNILGNQLFYATRITTNTNKISRMNLDGSGKATVIDASVSEKGYKFAHSGYNDTLAILNNDNGEVSLMTPSTGDNTVTVKLAKGASNIIFHRDGHMLMYYSGDKLSRYDLEKKKVSTFVPSGMVNSANWYLDESHFWVNTDRGLYIYDFDGANQVQIASSATSVWSINDRDNNAVFALEEGKKTLFTRFVSPF